VEVSYLFVRVYWQQKGLKKRPAADLTVGRIFRKFDYMLEIFM
jgi:hypothetical protein